MGAMLTEFPLVAVIISRSDSGTYDDEEYPFKDFASVASVCGSSSAPSVTCGPSYSPVPTAFGWRYAHLPERRIARM